MLIEYAPAKINLTLEILGRRGDGYHELASLVAFAQDVHDRLHLDVGAAPGVSQAGPFGAAIAGPNLIAKVLDLAIEIEPRLTLGAFELQKNLPVASGIGGGSADAAAALRLLKRANPSLAGTIDWPAFAAKLGSDVPVCLGGGPTLMSGRGEITAPVTVFPRLIGLLVNPMVAVPADKTARVFRALEAPPLSKHSAPHPPPPLASLEAVTDYMLDHPNGLEVAAKVVVPEISNVLSAIEDCEDCRIARLSGAGPTCFALFGSTDAAEEARRLLEEEHPQWWIARTRFG